VVRHAHDAQNKSQLDAWRAAQKQNVELYVPDQYSKYAERNVDRQYKERLHELTKGASASTNNAEVSSNDAQDVLDLYETESDKKKHDSWKPPVVPSPTAGLRKLANTEAAIWGFSRFA